MQDDNPLTRAVYIIMAALAGTITSLATMPWVTMNWKGIVLTIVTGVSFAVFAAPTLASSIFGIDDTSIRAACFISYAGGTTANVLVPVLINQMKKFIERFGTAKDPRA